MPNGDEASTEQIKADCNAWNISFARDQRGSFIQNHDHDCTSTCVKYAKKKTDTKVSEMNLAIFLCRFRYYHIVRILKAGLEKYIVRRGKNLVKKAFIATGNDENEYGKAMVVRDGPFRSSSQDVLQSTLRCNADYQYQRRAVPDFEASETDLSAIPWQTSSAIILLCGCGLLKTSVGKHIITTLATAMRAAHIADFYVTKYQSKAQEALGPVLQPFIAGNKKVEGRCREMEECGGKCAA